MSVHIKVPSTKPGLLLYNLAYATTKLSCRQPIKPHKWVVVLERWMLAEAIFQVVLQILVGYLSSTGLSEWIFLIWWTGGWVHTWSSRFPPTSPTAPSYNKAKSHYFCLRSPKWISLLFASAPWKAEGPCEQILSLRLHPISKFKIFWCSTPRNLSFIMSCILLNALRFPFLFFFCFCCFDFRWSGFYLIQSYYCAYNKS